MTTSTGFLLGKFMPPQIGHKYMCDFAQSYCDDLTIMVESHDGQPIDGRLRHQWMSEMFPKANVVHCHERLPQDPGETPDFWTIWADVLARYAPSRTDLVFASEHYGHRIAEILGARFVPVDIERRCRPISATMVRSDIIGHWDMLPEPVRAHYCPRVVVMGPESSGKSTLASALGLRLRTVVAPEYGRVHCDAFGMPDAEGLRLIARGHAAGVAAARRQANRVLIEDTDTAMTQVWADMLGEPRDATVESFWTAPDLYVVCDIDVPWVGDGQRWFPEPADRRRFLDLCIAEVEARETPWVIVRGSVDQRVRRTLQAIRTHLPDGVLS